MSKAQNFQSAEQPLSIDFTVKMLHGCRIVFGEIPVSALGMLTHGFSAKALMAIDIADRIGATLVIGEPEDLDKLREADLPPLPYAPSSPSFQQLCSWQFSFKLAVAAISWDCESVQHRPSGRLPPDLRAYHQTWCRADPSSPPL